MTTSEKELLERNQISAVDGKLVSIIRADRVYPNILHADYNGREVVVKVFHVERTSLGLVECKMQSSFDHPNILKPIGAYLNKRMELSMMTRFHFQGNLGCFVDSYIGYIPMEMCKAYISQILSAVKYLHSLGVAHRDIKADNVILGDDLNGVYLTDFGYSRYVTPGQLLDDAVGTPYYAPPELFKKLPHDPKKADVWAFGVYMFFLIYKTYPFRCKDEEETLPELASSVMHDPPSFPSDRDDVPEGVIGTLRTIFQKDFKLRPSIVAINL